MDRRALLVAGGVGAALFLVALASWLAGPGLADAAVLRALAGEPAWVISTASVLAFAGEAPVAFLLVATAAGLLAWRGRAPDAMRVVFAWAASEAAALGAKLVFARPRPLGALESGYSFPSGHAMRAAALALVAAWVLLREPRPFRRVGLLMGLAAAWAIAQAAERLVLGVHYASDVVGGLGLGMAVAGLVLAASAGAVSRNHGGTKARSG